MPTTRVLIEIRLSSQSRYKKKDIRERANELLATRAVFRSGPDDALLSELAPRYDVENVNVAILSCEREVPYFRAKLQYYVYRLNSSSPFDERVSDESDGTSATIYSHHVLPSAQFEGVWESLEIEADTKDQLLRYSASALLFADSCVNPRIVSCNRMILFHGPPGTGKTSLCQGLSQKLSIYNSKRYPKGVHLLEVNANALFSRWFSESGKLVAKLFELVRSLAEDVGSLVLVTIDEVESLTASRSTSSSADPSDATRVVNSMLTQIDKLRSFNNVMLLVTSNLTERIDNAFLDRADLKLYVGPPPFAARRRILVSCMYALMDAGIVAPHEDLEENSVIGFQTGNKAEEATASNWITKAAEVSEGMSGRGLRKLPLQAHAFYDLDQRVNALIMAKSFYSYLANNGRPANEF